jgi:hypothetical protein
MYWMCWVVQKYYRATGIDVFKQFGARPSLTAIPKYPEH